MKVHELKTWPEYMPRIASGIKTFEMRKNDRDFQQGDLLILRCWSPELKKFLLGTIVARVTYVLKDEPRFGLMQGYCVMGIKVLDADCYNIPTE